MRALMRPQLLLLTLAVTACATGGGGDGTPRRDPNTITPEELVPLADRSTYQAVLQLRPRWLATRGNVSLTTSDNRLPALIVDGQPRDLADLESIMPDEVQLLRYFNASDATMRWGTGYVNGAIQVTTRARR